MWGDYKVGDPNALTDKQREALINQSKLLAGITAAFVGEDVDVAANMAREVVWWNVTGKHPHQNRKPDTETLKDIILKFHKRYNDITILSISVGNFDKIYT